MQTATVCQKKHISSIMEKLKCVCSLMAKTVLIQITLTVITFIISQNLITTHCKVTKLYFYLANKDVSTITKPIKYAIKIKYNWRMNTMSKGISKACKKR